MNQRLKDSKIQNKQTTKHTKTGQLQDAMSPEPTPDIAMRTLRAHLQQQPQFAQAPGTHFEKSLSPLFGAFVLCIEYIHRTCSTCSF